MRLKVALRLDEKVALGIDYMWHRNEAKDGTGMRLKVTLRCD
jgi:hypothetical protein